MSNVQFIEKNGKREWAILPYKLYQKLVAEAEMAADLAAYREAKASDDGFRIPADILERELAGEVPIKLWRQERGLTQQALARAAGISKPYLSQIENGKRRASLVVMKALSEALQVPMDVLVD